MAENELFPRQKLVNEHKLYLPAVKSMHCYSNAYTVLSLALGIVKRVKQPLLKSLWFSPRIEGSYKAKFPDYHISKHTIPRAYGGGQSYEFPFPNTHWASNSLKFSSS